MKMIVAVGRTDAKTRDKWFSDDGLKRPYHVTTLDPYWFEAAAENGRSCTLFSSKLKLMRFVRTHEVICLEATDGEEETLSMGASMFAMGAKSIPIAGI